ncbi:MAG TPA: hypothetical protein VG939_19595 [Caulobacteraceae bacterium]|nr:hypothetical protein [Caulobacteraceae bacterium]
MDISSGLGAIVSLGLMCGSAFLAQAACFKAVELIGRRRRRAPDGVAAAASTQRP